MNGKTNEVIGLMAKNYYDSLLHAVTQPETLGYELLRDILLPDLLGQEAPGILYWAGKDLARRLPLQKLADLPTFFEQFNFGHLTLSQQTKNRYIYRLAGGQVKQRQKAFAQADFQLEAGFLAQQTQQITQAVAEGQLQPERDAITIIIQTDQTDRPADSSTGQPIQLHHFGEATRSQSKAPTAKTPKKTSTPVSELMPKRTERHRRSWFRR
ncbi:hypothetical protein FC24_GL001942 [Loigolactobacillus rennini DSM 20253]|uniref:DUF2507 domain-containing protein n=2 Tax=Loigolactobacillus rennini TaxID=238013 RepID=A0A0R2CWT8_9LACO|nr:hypothetical protein FC24_GL001942 [Loigolactobacillus rennini DSM 20253]